MTIRTYRPEDREELLALWNATGLLVPGSDYELDLDRKVAFQPELLFVAEAAGCIVGSVMAGYEGRRGWLNCLAVAPELQRSGHGRALVEHAERRLAELGCVKVNVQIRRSNASVIDFYTTLGFRDDNVIGMGKRLDSPSKEE